MSNVLEPHKQQEVLALGRLGWTLTRIGRATGVHRVTVGEYLRAAGLPIRGRGRPGEGLPKPTISREVSTDSVAKPATTGEVSIDSGLTAGPSRAPTASACEPYRELIETAVASGRNAMAIWQDLVDDHRFPARYASVRRFVAALRGATPPEARVVIPTSSGQEGQVDYGDGPMVWWPETRKADAAGEVIGRYAAALLDSPLPWTRMRRVGAQPSAKQALDALIEFVRQ